MIHHIESKARALHLGAHKETEHLATLLFSKPILGQHTLAHHGNDIRHELVFLQHLVHHRESQVDDSEVRLANLNHHHNSLIDLEYNAKGLIE